MRGTGSGELSEGRPDETVQIPSRAGHARAPHPRGSRKGRAHGREPRREPCRGARRREPRRVRVATAPSWSAIYGRLRACTVHARRRRRFGDDGALRAPRCAHGRRRAARDLDCSAPQGHRARAARRPAPSRTRGRDATRRRPTCRRFGRRPPCTRRQRMTVVPVPITPAPQAKALDPSSKEPAAPGFAKKLSNAQRRADNKAEKRDAVGARSHGHSHSDATKKTTTSEDAKSHRAKSDVAKHDAPTEQEGALTDATVLEILAALEGTVPTAALAATPAVPASPATPANVATPATPATPAVPATPSTHATADTAVAAATPVSDAAPAPLVAAAAAAEPAPDATPAAPILTTPGPAPGA